MIAAEHDWGASPSADRVWSLVSGFSPVALAGKRPLMVMQAFIDDSHDDELYVLAGHIASVEAWAQLSRDWERLLPKFGVLSSSGRYAFKMSEMAKLPERMERVAPFYRLIEEHVTISISAWLRKSDIKRAFSRLVSPTATLAFENSIRPFDLVFCGLLDWMNKSKAEVSKWVDYQLPIDFYFDEQSEKTLMWASWDKFVATRQADFKDFVGGVPRFEDDEKFLPLQAADLWAWWVREWIEADTPEQMHMPDFGPFQAAREDHIKVDFQLTEDTLARVLRTSALAQLGPGHLIYDVKFPFSREHQDSPDVGIVRIS
ncbi:MAG: DUF3800 domain-containing protein [Sphingomicrobium sp.]